MTKHTSTVLLTSAATIGPWGDPLWRIGGLIQYVSNGPDWLLGQAVGSLSDVDAANAPRTLVISDDRDLVWADVAVMVLAMDGSTEVDEDLAAWWEGDEDTRRGLLTRLEHVLAERRGLLKVGVVRLGDPDLDVEVLRVLSDRGMVVVELGGPIMSGSAR